MFILLNNLMGCNEYGFSPFDTLNIHQFFEIFLNVIYLFKRRKNKFEKIKI